MLTDITKLEDISSLDEHSLDSYLFAYGLRKMLKDNSATQKRKMLKGIRDQLRLRNSIYPSNVSLWDFLLFTCSPTLCYSPIYPRTKHGTMDAASTRLRQNINGVYVLEKAIMAVGIIVCMYLTLRTR